MLRAIKIIHKRSTGPEDLERFMNEVEILKKLVLKRIFLINAYFH